MNYFSQGAWSAIPSLLRDGAELRGVVTDAELLELIFDCGAYFELRADELGVELPYYEQVDTRTKLGLTRITKLNLVWCELYDAKKQKKTLQSQTYFKLRADELGVELPYYEQVEILTNKTTTKRKLVWCELYGMKHTHTLQS